MQLYNALLFVTAVTAYIVPRDVTSVLNNLRTINTQTNALTASINQWDGSFFGALSIASASNSLGTAIDNTRTDASDEAVFSSANSNSVLTFISGTLSPSTTTALTALVGREDDVAALGLDSLVLGQINTLRSKTAALSSSLVAISSADTQDAARTQAANLDAAFVPAVAAYS